MKILLTIGFILLAQVIFSQNRSFNFGKIDHAVLSVDSDDPATLSALLTQSLTTEEQKVRAIFSWITENISYYRNVPPARKNRNRKDGKKEFTYIDEENDDDTGTLKPLTERVAINVLKSRRTHCEGYSRLFKSLCDHAGIRSEIITGYARTDMYRAEKSFRSNHSWNAVQIDSNWYLLDATWASGFISASSGEFIKHYNDYYYLTPPDQFIEHHYPDDIRWSLLPEIPPIYELRFTPFKQRSFVKYAIKDYYPFKGIIKAAVGDTIKIELQTLLPYNNINIAPDSLWDSSRLVYSPYNVYIQPDTPVKSDKIVYTYPVDSDTVQWIYVMYNNDAILRYKLNIQRDNARK